MQIVDALAQMLIGAEVKMYRHAVSTPQREAMATRGEAGVVEDIRISKPGTGPLTCIELECSGGIVQIFLKDGPHGLAAKILEIMFASGLNIPERLRSEIEVRTTKGPTQISERDQREATLAERMGSRN